MSTPLTEAERDAALARRPAWRLTSDGTAIERTFLFGDFPAAFAFMARVALVAEKLGHHPDWSNSYRRVEVRLTTHDAGGLTVKDFELAERIDGFAGD